MEVGRRQVANFRFRIGHGSWSNRAVGKVASFSPVLIQSPPPPPSRQHNARLVQHPRPEGVNFLSWAVSPQHPPPPKATSSFVVSPACCQGGSNSAPRLTYSRVRNTPPMNCIVVSLVLVSWHWRVSVAAVFIKGAWILRRCIKIDHGSWRMLYVGVVAPACAHASAPLRLSRGALILCLRVRVRVRRGECITDFFC